MQDFQTHWVVLVGICIGWAAVATFVLAGRKVFFERYVDPEDKS